MRDPDADRGVDLNVLRRALERVDQDLARIGMLGAKRAGSDGRKRLEGARTGGFARTREAVFKALAMLKD